MADIIGDGRLAVWWLPAVASQNAPTTGEFAAGTRISQWMTKDGLNGFQPDTADAPTSSIESTFDTATNGRTSFSNMVLKFKKQSGTDTVYTTLVRDAAGFLAIRRSVTAATAVASSQAVEVYPVICGETRKLDPDDNMPERFEVPIKLTAAPSLRAAVA